MADARFMKICSARMTDTTAAMPAARSPQPCSIQRCSRGFDRVVVRAGEPRRRIYFRDRRAMSGTRPVTPCSSSSASSSSGIPRLRSTSVGVLAQQRRVAAVEALRAPREPDGQGAVAGHSRHGMIDVLEEPAELQLRQRRLIVGLQHLGDGDAGSPQAVDDLVAGPRPAPDRQLGVDGVVVRSPTGNRRERRLDGPVGSIERVAEGQPLVVARDRDRDPSVAGSGGVDVGGEVHVLRCRSRTAIAVALEQLRRWLSTR